MSTVASARTMNRLLAALPYAEWLHLEPDLEWVDLEPGAVLYEYGVVLKHAYFPTTAIVSLVTAESRPPRWQRADRDP